MSTPPRTSEYRRREQSITLSPLDEQLEHPADDEQQTTQELLTLNFGPHHPATHGVLRLLVTLQGEVVRDIKPIIGYVHTGIEKTAEDKSYWKVIPVIERMDYLAYHFNSLAYIGAVETLAEVVVPTRAEYLRVIHLELNRIASHLFWLGTSALDLGAISMFWYGMREREQINDLFEMSTGQRMHTRYFQIGGVAEDIPVGWAAKVRGLPRRHARPPGPVRRSAQQQRDRAAAPAWHLRAGRRDAAVASASPARCCAPPATRGTCARPRRTAATATSTSRSPWARSATTTTASPCAWPRCTSR